MSDEITLLRRKFDITVANLKLRTIVITLYSIGGILCLYAPLPLYIATILLLIADYVITIEGHCKAMHKVKLNQPLAGANRIMITLSLFNVLLYGIILCTALVLIEYNDKVRDQLAILKEIDAFILVLLILKMSMLIMMVEKLYNLFITKRVLKLEYIEPPIAKIIKFTLNQVIKVTSEK